MMVVGAFNNKGNRKRNLGRP